VDALDIDPAVFVKNIKVVVRARCEQVLDEVGRLAPRRPRSRACVMRMTPFAPARLAR